MNRSAVRILIAIAVAAIGVYLGVRLAMFSEADDAPGGVLMGGALALGSLVLGAWIVRRGSRQES